MKLPLPARIFLLHLLFMIALGVLGAFLVHRAFQRYEEAWERELRSLPSEKLFSPVATEVARSLLLRLEDTLPEPKEKIRTSVGEALDRVLATIPSIERLVVLDEQQRVQYTTGSVAAGITLADGVDPRRLPATPPLRRSARLGSGAEVTEVVFPVDDPATGERLGAVLAHYRPDPALLAELREQLGARAAVDGDRLVENALNPFLEQIARSVLREAQRDATAEREQHRVRISDGLNQVLGAVPLESLVIVDVERRIQYVSDPEALDLKYTGADSAELFASPAPVRREVATDGGQSQVELMLPVFAAGADGDADRRLGSVLIRYRPDPELIGRIPDLTPPSVAFRDYLEPLIAFLGVAALGSILVAVLSGVPVRRLERALDDYRKRGFKGELVPEPSKLPPELAGTARTITELASRLETLDAQGREREALLATLFQSLEDGMVALDPAGRPVSWNPAAARILAGAGTDDEVDAESLIAALERTPDLRFVASTDAAAGTTREVELEHPEGGRTLLRVAQHPIELRPGATGTLLFLRDLGALRKVERHLLDAGRYAVLAHLAAGLAHEIRNPLHAIQLNASVVEQHLQASLGEGPRAGAVGESLSTIQEQATRLTRLLNNYLGMIRPGQEAGPVDMHALCGRVIQLVRYAAGRSHIEIRLEGEASPPVVLGVGDRLQQALLNLVLNAIQAMPGGGTLTLRVAAVESTVRVTVSDTGPGLAQEMADQLFDTRLTTKPEGSGLGLPLVRLIVEDHGGGVWYRSPPEGGASFTLVLPARQPVARAAVFR